MSAGLGRPESGDRDLRAAEYVLGTLSFRERSAFELELAIDREAEAAVRAWEKRLSPLSLTLPDIVPPASVWEAVAASVRGSLGSPANDNRLGDLARQVRRWRLAAGGAGLLAAGLAVFVAVGQRAPAPVPGTARYVAIVQSGGELPALIVSVDTAAGTAQVRPVKAEAPNGQGLQLWFVGADAKPKPLGMIGVDASRVALPPDAGTTDGGVFAVSVEPPGGSPTGQPTGKVIYTGKLIRD